MTGTRLSLVVLAAALMVPTAHAGGLFPRKPRTDAARLKQLVEGLRTEADEKKRKAAVAELKDFDPRTHPDVIAALTTALQRDPSAVIRAEAADAIGQFKLVYPVAGLALEAAAESDPSPAVRRAAQQTLWEYHLIGYRSAKGADGIAGQTTEPPIARPPVRRIPYIPSRSFVTAEVKVPPLPVTPLATVPPAVMSPTSVGFPVAAIPGVGPRILISSAPPPILNLTDEPPIAQRRGGWSLENLAEPAGRQGARIRRAPGGGWMLEKSAESAEPAGEVIPPPDSIEPPAPQRRPAPAADVAPIPPTRLPTAVPLPALPPTAMPSRP